ncbi:MAG: endonuclease/exonuclease/phosphatase family protein [Candidatus Roizmanbacteria bacterium]
MNIRILQLNMFMGRYLENIKNFLKIHTYDILHFQEVTNGLYSKQKGTDCFEELQSILPDHNGELLATWRHTEDNASYFGNATFYNKSFSLEKKNEVWMKPFALFGDVGKHTAPLVPRAGLDLTLNKDGVSFHSINVHMAWTPQSNIVQPHQLEQGTILAKYIATIKDPYFLTGDFNTEGTTSVAQLFDPYVENLTMTHNIKNTLNMKNHYAKDKIGDGVAVDFIMIKKGLPSVSFKVIRDVELSDHLALETEITI